jgi:hypothetical protein
MITQDQDNCYWVCNYGTATHEEYTIVPISKCCIFISLSMIIGLVITTIITLIII